MNGISLMFRNEARANLLTTLRKEEKEKNLQTSRDRSKTHHPTPSTMYVEETSPYAVRYHLAQCNHHDAGGTLLKGAIRGRISKLTSRQPFFRGDV
jgi:hypothetical protein